MNLVNFLIFFFQESCDDDQVTVSLNFLLLHKTILASIFRLVQYLQVRLSLPIDGTIEETLDYPSNIMLGWKTLLRTNATAYSVTLSVMNKFHNIGTYF
jgi:hypothetical protein